MRNFIIRTEELVVFKNHELGVFYNRDNIGLGLNADALISVEPYTSVQIEARIECPDDYEPPDLLNDDDWEII